jgi:quercetin dioxygenase-like cupin family protein
MMIKRRDVIVAALAGVATLCVVWAADDKEKPAVLHSTAFDWDSVAAKPTAVGSVRQFLKSPTQTLDELELHVTTLEPGKTSHAPHTHANEELVIVKEGAVEALVNGQWVKLGPGSVIFNGSNELHGLKSVGSTPAVYHVINWRSPGSTR